MAEIKDKVVTVESLSALKNYDDNTFMTKNNPTGSGLMTIDGDGDFSGNVKVNSITINDGVKLEFDASLGALNFTFLS